MEMQEVVLNRFGVSAGELKQALQLGLSKGGDFSELFFQDSKQTTLSLDDHSVNVATSNQDFGAGLRVIADEKVGYAYTEVITAKSLNDAARTAANIANSAQKTTVVDLDWKVPASFYAKRNQIMVSDAPKQVALLQDLDTRIFDADERIVKVQLSLMVQEAEVLIANSEGVLVADFQPMLMLIASVVAEEDGKREQNRHNISARAGFEFLTKKRVEQFVKDLVDGATQQFGAIQPKGGEMEVVLGAGGSGILLHEAIGHGLEADFNRKGQSIFSDKIGERIAEPFVSIIDDGTMRNTRGAVNVDDEGVAGQKTTLVENGVLTSYIHDKISAKHYGLSPTGNGRRQSFRHEPMPRMRNTYMLEGPHTQGEIVASVKHGIFADNFTNGQVNIGAGDFTFYVKSGYLIENGKFTARIKDINIIGNGPQVLKDITMVAKNMEISDGGWTCGKAGQSVPVSIGMPAVKVKRLTVGGK